jgi:hypothetical protein
MQLKGTSFDVAFLPTSYHVLFKARPPLILSCIGLEYLPFKGGFRGIGNIFILGFEILLDFTFQVFNFLATLIGFVFYGF